MAKHKNDTNAAIKDITDYLAQHGDPWTAISVAERRSYVNDAYHDILNNQIADTYKKNFEEMLDSLSRLSGPTPDQAAGIYFKYKDFLNKYYHIAEYYQPKYMESYKKFQMLVNNYSEARNTTPNYPTRKLLSEETTNGKQTIRVEGGIWDVANAPVVEILIDSQGTYSRARKVAMLIRNKTDLHTNLLTYSRFDLKNAFELLGISDRQIEIYAKAASLGHVGWSSFQNRTPEGQAAFDMLKIAIGMRHALAFLPKTDYRFIYGRLASDWAVAAMRDGIRKSGVFTFPLLIFLTMSYGVDSLFDPLSNVTIEESVFGKVPLGDSNKQDAVGLKALSETRFFLVGRP